MKIEYKGSKYESSFWDSVKISNYKLRLFIQRKLRYVRMFLIKKNLFLFLLLTILWALIVRLLNMLGYDIINCSLDIILAYITSVIITIFISIYNQAEKYHTTLHRQYQICINATYTFDELFDPFLRNINNHYMPFYNRHCLDEALNKSRNSIIHVNEKFLVSLENALETIRTIKSEKQNDYIFDNNILDVHINDSEKELRILILQVKNNRFQWTQFEKTCFELESLIDSLRSPWRKDLKTDQKILSILTKNNAKLLLEDFYLRMWLYNIDDIIAYEVKQWGSL